MINKDRIVPVQKIDLISLYQLILHASGAELSVLQANNVEGDFVLNEAGNYLANEPVKSIAIDELSDDATVYFVAGYNYAGFTYEGNSVTAEGEVNADGVTLYVAVISNGEVTITPYIEYAATDGQDSGGGSGK